MVSATALVPVSPVTICTVTNYGIVVNSSQNLSLRSSGGFLSLKFSRRQNLETCYKYVNNPSLINTFPFSNEMYQENTGIHGIFEPYADDISYKKPDKGEIEFRVVL